MCIVKIFNLTGSKVMSVTKLDVSLDLNYIWEKFQPSKSTRSWVIVKTDRRTNIQDDRKKHSRGILNNPYLMYWQSIECLKHNLHCQIWYWFRHISWEAFPLESLSVKRLSTCQHLYCRFVLFVKFGRTITVWLIETPREIFLEL